MFSCRSDRDTYRGLLLTVLDGTGVGCCPRLLTDTGGSVEGGRFGSKDGGQESFANSPRGRWGEVRVSSFRYFPPGRGGPTGPKTGVPIAGVRGTLSPFSSTIPILSFLVLYPVDPFPVT